MQFADSLKEPYMKRIPTKSLGTVGFLAMMAAPLAAYADVDFRCKPIQVIERSNRIGVMCANTVVAGTDTIQFITYAKTDVAVMERFIRAATSALLGKKTLAVEVPESGAGNLLGCDASNCRTITFPFAVMD